MDFLYIWKYRNMYNTNVTITTIICKILLLLIIDKYLLCLFLYLYLLIHI